MATAEWPCLYSEDHLVYQPEDSKDIPAAGASKVGFGIQMAC